MSEEVGPEECLRERKWWCFLLSSILTFVMGVSGVFILRVLKFIFCREREEDEYWERRPIQEPKDENPVVPASDIYAEAKNWAGELISGQNKGKDKNFRFY
eukprot:TRINITY_DN37449_c0_g1_i1.p2 TRINITY_DN37449_c0_g1~~TRINITY_DN37449_c0_g1_i1.p2  ORF type:complete len:101 (-),score=23.43 TRINITY_DN37449_c0_g1_i1:34-336(-)